MADKRRFLDLWILETNTVYQEVPYDVVTDWIQQGRLLLPEDRVRPSGTGDWFQLGDRSDLTPYLPSAAAHSAEDVAEALEAVEIEPPVQRSPEDEDDDVDMIPLIDVTLVLLIFFILTGSTAAGLTALVRTPDTEFGVVADGSRGIRVDITKKDGQVAYAVGIGDRPPAPDEKEIYDFQHLLRAIRGKLPEQGRIELVINADKDLPAGVPRDVLIALSRDPTFRNRISTSFYGASQREK